MKGVHDGKLPSFLYGHKDPVHPAIFLIVEGGHLLKKLLHADPLVDHIVEFELFAAAQAKRMKIGNSYSDICACTTKFEQF